MALGLSRVLYSLFLLIYLDNNLFHPINTYFDCVEFIKLFDWIKYILLR